jgi:DNA-binding transcriptional LysR family regulator
MTLGLLPEFVNTSALRYFYEVAQSGSFRRAADRIRIAPSAISRQIQLLEDELGVELFERGRKGVRLTVAGETLIYRVRRTMNELAAARSEIGALHGRNRGLINFGVNETIGREFIIDFLARFHKTYPGITFNVVVGNTATLVDLLLRGDIEIMVGYGVPERRGLERVASFNLDTCIVVRKQHRLAQKKWVRVADFLEEELILPDERSLLRQVLNAMFAQISAKPLSAITINSFELMADMVVAGLGVGAQIRLTPGADELRPDIMYVPIKDNEVRSAVLACCVRTGREPSPAVVTCTRQLANALQTWAQPE